MVFPRTCVRCGTHVTETGLHFTCGACRAEYAWIRDPVCRQCGVPIQGVLHSERKCPACREDPPVFERARSLFLYRGTGARLIHALKYEGGIWLRPEISSLIAGHPRWQSYFKEAILVPVPLHKHKLRARGYNQAIVVAEAIAAAVPGTAVVCCLQRMRPTPSQTFLTRSQRQENMKGAFACTGPPVGDGRIMVVDDVLTTGATLNAAVQALKDKGLSGISAFTLAHG